ncbi:aldo/keto reductase [Rhodoferax sediminis]|uniref:Aldo/keto reductase n=1 Tax=Rhodoferax sediminis TaxID=2509614 RepID=A0A515DE00_9BURK|nr:aldo/keto reductase [Rhodoferax sediminis]QDL38636.1 aldo/keto reductase [Rhodoferax sediminis]
MEYRRLGRSGLKVSPLCLGAMMFGDQTDESVSRSIIASAREAGVNFIDTADAYAAGKSEQIIGGAVKAERDRWVVATKVGFLADPLVPAGPDLSRKNLMRAADQSLRRLDTDYIDLYYLHRDDFSTALEETIHALADLIHQGKIRYFGISNFRAWRVAEVVRLCDQFGIDRPVACQPQYNAMNRMSEAELFPACQFYGIGVVPYSPLARGVLTGKYAAGGALPEGSRAARKDKRILQTELRNESVLKATEFKSHAEARGSTASHFALKWVLNSTIVTSVICGPRTMDQWTDYLAASEEETPFTSEDEALVDRLVPPGHPSTPGYTDPNYPVTGRSPRIPAS